MSDHADKRRCKQNGAVQVRGREVTPPVVCACAAVGSAGAAQAQGGRPRRQFARALAMARWLKALAAILLLAAAASARKTPSKSEPQIEEVTAKQLERVLEDKDFVAVYWCECSPAPAHSPAGGRRERVSANFASFQKLAAGQGGGGRLGDASATAPVQMGYRRVNDSPSPATATRVHVIPERLAVPRYATERGDNKT